MGGGIPESRHRMQVIPGRIPLVPVESIAGIRRVKLAHERVPHYLGNDGGGGNGRAPDVAVDDAPLGHHQIRDPEGIDQDEVR